MKIRIETEVTGVPIKEIFFSYDQVIKIYENELFFGDIKIFNGEVVSESYTITQLAKRLCCKDGKELINFIFLN